MMDDIEPKKTRHIYIGVLILVIIIVFILFKVNLKKAVTSPYFEENVVYIQSKNEYGYEHYLRQPTLRFWNWLKLAATGDFKFTSPKVDQSTFDKVVEPSKIKKYFGNTDQETVDRLSSPTGN